MKIIRKLTEVLIAMGKFYARHFWGITVSFILLLSYCLLRRDFQDPTIAKSIFLLSIAVAGYANAIGLFCRGLERFLLRYLPKHRRTCYISILLTTLAFTVLMALLKPEPPAELLNLLASPEYANDDILIQVLIQAVGMFLYFVSRVALVLYCVIAVTKIDMNPKRQISYQQQGIWTTLPEQELQDTKLMESEIIPMLTKFHFESSNVPYEGWELVDCPSINDPHVLFAKCRNEEEDITVELEFNVHEPDRNNMRFIEIENIVLLAGRYFALSSIKDKLPGLPQEFRCEAASFNSLQTLIHLYKERKLNNE